MIVIHTDTLIYGEILIFLRICLNPADVVGQTAPELWRTLIFYGKNRGCPHQRC